MNNSKYRYSNEKIFSNIDYYVYFIDSKYLNDRGEAMFDGFGVSKQDVSPILEPHEIYFILETLETAEIINKNTASRLNDSPFKGAVYAFEGLAPFVEDTCIFIISPGEDEIFVMGVQDGRKLLVQKKYNAKLLEMIKILKRRDIILEDLIFEDFMDER